ncbi:hypothetical protein FFI97_004055 [Variovorax sp. KBS0712]|uniref:hypothetical protein n=1 Tax=Variovorax sp. KBS0712 TaxID=2578111 RepID=UPI00111866C6|nr:hypothetical protein [Variovorax sp. KBS0712]TSD59513.1 hypothetical protein FFI97_004055 [Variovorax sp. KBS0712]
MKEGKDGNPANGQGSDESTAARRAPQRAEGAAWLKVNKRAARIGTVRWPIRRRLVGGIEGRQACAAGIGYSQSPGEPWDHARSAHDEE